MRIAHFSDPHFYRISLHPKQFLSKQWIGNMNALLFRRRSHHSTHLTSLPTFLSSLQVEYIFLTGDISSTSAEAEFAEGQQLACAFQEHRLPLFVLPGNHDCYTKDAESKKIFYAFFPDEQLSTQRIAIHPLRAGWWYIALDCTVATPPFCAYGIFTAAMEEKLKEILHALPSSDRVVMANHFPLYSSHRHGHVLKRAAALQELLQDFPAVSLYLHGHEHMYYVIDRQSDGFPLVLNSGSCSLYKEGGFFLIDIQETSCLVERFVCPSTGSMPLSQWKKDYPLSHR